MLNQNSSQQLKCSNIGDLKRSCLKQQKDLRIFFHDVLGDKQYDKNLPTCAHHLNKIDEKNRIYRRNKIWELHSSYRPDINLVWQIDFESIHIDWDGTNQFSLHYVSLCWYSCTKFMNWNKILHIVFNRSSYVSIPHEASIRLSNLMPH